METNARIATTFLGVEDHGILTAMITLEGDGWGQGFGGWALDDWSPEKKRRIGTAYGMEWVAALMRVVGVESWEQLVGKHVRVRREDITSPIFAIGHIVKDQWFEPRGDLEWLLKGE